MGRKNAFGRIIVSRKLHCGQQVSLQSQYDFSHNM